MTNDLKFFKELDEKLFMKIGYQTSEMIFYYTKNNEKYRIELEEKESSTNDQSIFLEDKEGLWDPNEHDLIVSMQYYINNPTFLFNENGIAQPGAIVGIAMSWHSKNSNQRGIKKLGSLEISTTSPYQGEVNYKFSKKQLLKDFTIELILYLEVPSSMKKPYLADQPGTVLGLLDSKFIVIDGQGSNFPIAEVYAPERPLWFVTFNFTDAMSDPFSEDYVCINLNTAHKNFQLISGKKGNSNAPLLSEVIAGALQVIIQKVLGDSEGDNIRSGIGFEDGSIAQAVYYFITNFEWDVSSPEKLAESIRRDWETRIDGEDI